MAERAEGKWAEGLPIWYEADGYQINQSKAIMRYLGKQHGYYQGSEREMYEIDYICDNHNDLMDAKCFGCFLPNQMNAEQIKECCDNIDKTLCLFETKMKAHGKTYIAGGDKVTIADFLVFAFVSSTALNKGVIHPSAGEQVRTSIDAKPCLKAWSCHMEEMFKEYLDARKPMFA